MTGFPLTLSSCQRPNALRAAGIDQQDIDLIIQNDDPIFDVFQDRIEFLQFVHTPLERSGCDLYLAARPVADAGWHA